MADTKKYYWLKLKDDFFRDKRIKKLRRIAGGDTYTVIYLKMQLLSIKNNGVLIYEGIEDNFAEELALELDEDTENVKVTLAFLQGNGMIEETEPDHFLMTETIKCIGSESTSAERVRKHREKKAQNALPKPEAKTNAERQKAFRAKKACEEQQHIPLVEDHLNATRYNGNYYVVMKRDKFKCAICNSIENLCVHHIDGYDPLKPHNSNENKMLVLCRHCHSHIHAGAEIPSSILESIDYYSNGNEMCNGYVTTSNTEIEKEKDREIELETEEETELKALSPIGDAAERNKAEVISYEEIAFNEFWSAYPKKVNKKGCYKSFCKIKHLKEEMPLIMSALERFKASKGWQKDNGQFIPHPTTWINQERWKDEHIETREDKLKTIDMDGWL